VTATEKTAWIAEHARAAGFDLCGVASVNDYIAEAARLPEWLARGYAGQMHYLHDPRRMDPRQVLPGARSLIVCAMNYNTEQPYSTEVLPDLETPRGWISRYAWGEDYHNVLGGGLKWLLAGMRKQFSEPFEARWYVDTGPVVERLAAKCAGLGWLAKNTCLINEGLGSWLFLGVIVTTLELAPTLPAEGPPPDLCGQCTLCMEACPTGAIVEPYLLDPRRCISYFTIELRGEIPAEFHKPLGRHVFGCDVCQDVCPWNRKAPVTTRAEFAPRQFQVATTTIPVAGESVPESAAPATSSPPGTGRSLLAPELEWLLSLSEKEFREVFRGSPIQRAKWQGLLRNACVALANWLSNQKCSAGEPGPISAQARPPDNVSLLQRTSHSKSVRERIVVLLKQLATSKDTVIAAHARQALDCCISE
jgi:epoxyqueuosine reductase